MDSEEAKKYIRLVKERGEPDRGCQRSRLAGGNGANETSRLTHERERERERERESVGVVVFK
jgi:hypothetical protein